MVCRHVAFGVLAYPFRPDGEPGPSRSLGHRVPVLKKRGGTPIRGGSFNLFGLHNPWVNSVQAFGQALVQPDVVAFSTAIAACAEESTPFRFGYRFETLWLTSFLWGFAFTKHLWEYSDTPPLEFVSIEFFICGVHLSPFLHDVFLDFVLRSILENLGQLDCWFAAYLLDVQLTANREGTGRQQSSLC